jgi:hypothetical protein
MQPPTPSSDRNPFVDYLNSLRTQQADGNPSYVHETRQVFLDALRARWSWLPSDDDLHIPGELDHLLDALRDGRVPSGIVFLTGDAGDGKTALCARLAAALGHAGGLNPVTTVGTWTIIKDASEVPEADLREEVARHLATADMSARLVVAVNEGRLRRLFREPFPERPGLWDRAVEPALNAGLTEEAAKSLDEAMQAERVLVVNFRHRFHVRSLLAPLLEAWTKPALWEKGPVCSGCPALGRCPIQANAVSLREAQTRSHISDLLTAVHFAGQRLPFRRLQALLALAATGGLTCHDVLAGPLNRAPDLDALRYRYYEALFRSDAGGPVSVQPELLTLSLACNDAGRTASREFDEMAAALVLSGDGVSPAELDGHQLDPFERETIEGVRKSIVAGSEDVNVRVARLVRSLRRWVALRVGRRFEGVYWQEALRLLEGYATRGDEKPLREAMTGALNQLHGLRAMKTDVLVAHQLDPGGFRDDARLGLEIDLGTDFDVELKKGPVMPPTQIDPWLEACPSEIYLEAWPREARQVGTVRLQLDTRLVGALLGVAAGYRSYGSVGPYRRDLGRFFSRLGDLAVRAGRQPAVSLRIGGARVRASASADRLRFDVEG